MSDDMASMPIRDLIAGFRKQVDELPSNRFLDQLLWSVIANRFEAMANDNDDLSARVHVLTDRCAHFEQQLDRL